MVHIRPLALSEDFIEDIGGDPNQGLMVLFALFS